MKITIKTQAKNQIKEVQKAFEKHLSAKVIQKVTAQAINGTIGKAIVNKEFGIKTAIKQGYNLPNNKYLDKKAIFVSPKATSTSLYGGIKLSTRPMPLIEFKPKQYGSIGNKGSGGVTVQIQKGKTSVFPGAFIEKMPSGNTHVFARGRYQGKKLVSVQSLPASIGKGGKYAKPAPPMRKQKGISNPSSKLYKREGITNRPITGGGTGGRIGAPYTLDALSSVKTTSPYRMAVSNVVAKKVSDFMAKEVVRATQGMLQQKVDQFVKHSNLLASRYKRTGDIAIR